MIELNEEEKEILENLTDEELKEIGELTIEYVKASGHEAFKIYCKILRKVGLA